MSTDKRPQRTNLGGIHILNPPEPYGNLTSLEGVRRYADTVSAGACTNIPSLLKLTVGGQAPPDFEHLAGTFILRRANWGTAALAANPRPLGIWLGSQLDVEWSFGPSSQITYDWVLYYGDVGPILQGPYVDGFEFRKTWWLIGEAGLHSSSYEAFGAEVIYSLYRSTVASNVFATIPSVDSAGKQLELFDALQPNEFFYHAAELEESPFGQRLTVSPYYP